MKEISRHHYEKRIKQLEEENRAFRDYRRVSMNIYGGIMEMVTQGKTINQGWILDQMRGLFK